jgi:hypothetical protein
MKWVAVAQVKFDEINLMVTTQMLPVQLFLDNDCKLVKTL